MTRRDAERVRDEMSGIGPGSSGRRDGVGTGRGTSHNRRASRIRFSLLDHVSASLGVSDFDTTSSVTGGTFKSNISLVDPTIQFSRTEKRLVEWGVSFTISPVKNPYLHPLLPPFASPDHRGQWLWLWQ